MNTLFYGDNLPILRTLPSESIDLIYLDPPFNSRRSYNVLFRDESGVSADAQITAFDDSWHWGQSAEQAYTDLIQANPGTIDDLIAALRGVIGENQMMAYLVMMAIRLVEMHRVLKSTGSIYLHCDTTASHYLKIILDTLFGFEHFQNEIVWKRTTAHNDPQRYGRISDRILFYSKTDKKIFNHVHGEYTPEQMSRYKYNDDQGLYRAENLTAPHYSPTRTTEWRGIHPGSNRQWRFSLDQLENLYSTGRILLKQDGTPRKDGLKEYLSEAKGSILQDIWLDIAISPTSAERLGYPTQKPLALLERIVQASSNPGDIVLDPFCGCGTAIAAAEKLGRKWIGIDVTYLAINLIENRMKMMFPNIRFEVKGKPADLASAHNFAERDRYQFQWWALSLVGAKPVVGDLEGQGKKGKDKGIDGIINYIDSTKAELKRVIVQVKSGHVNSATVRDLRGVLDREQAQIGVLITLELVTKDMNTEAVSAGYYKSDFWGKSYPKLQILTIDQLLSGTAQVQMPPETGTFLAAQKAKKIEGKQGEFDL